MVEDARLTKSEVVSFESQSLLDTISRFSLCNMFSIIGSTPSEFLFISSDSNFDLVSDFPEGSPT